MDEQAPGFRPPYLSFTTFWTFVRELADKPLPPRIDRSLMRTKSGGDQVALTAAMKAFGLIDSNLAVTGLRDLAATDEEGRLRWLASQINEHYAAQMKVSADNGTEQQLRDSFRESFPTIESTDTLRKTMTFFLHAARTAKVTLSPYFPSTRSGSGAPGASKPRRPATKRKQSQDARKETTDDGASFTAAGDTYTLKMMSGPVMTLAVEMNVMTASVEDRNFIFEVVDKLRDYGNRTPSQSPHGTKAAAGASAESTEATL